MTELPVQQMLLGPFSGRSGMVVRARAGEGQGKGRGGEGGRRDRGVSQRFKAQEAIYT